MRCSSLLAFTFLASAAAAQTAINADCSHAITLTVASGNIQNEFAYVDGRQLPSAPPAPATSCSGSANHGSAWFSFTATSTTHWIRTEGDGLDPSSMEVFSGTCGSLTSIACFPSNSATPQVTGLSVGTTYYLRVLTENPVFCANDCLVWVAVVSAPVNDECTGAIDLPVIASALDVRPGTEISTLGATQSQAACTGGATAANDDVWYRFTATNTAHFFPTALLSGGSPTVQWFSGSCGSLTSIGCGVDEQSGLAPGQTYYIRVHSASTSATVTTRAVADLFAPSPIDECSGALPITVMHNGDTPAPVDLSTINSTSSTTPCATSTHDVWLSFTAPGPSVTVLSNATANGAIFSGSCGSLTCVWNNAPLQSGWTFDGLTAGTSYYLKIGTSSGRNTAVWMFASPDNDECADAVDLPVTNDGPTYTNGYTFGATQSMPQNCGPLPLDVWYSFTAGTGRHLVDCVRAVTPDASVYVEVFSGACGSLTSLACQQTSTIPLALDGLVPGSIYHVRVLSSTSAPGGFRIGIRKAAPNDECADATVLSYSTLEDYEVGLRSSNSNAADGTGGCYATHDTWYRFTAAHSTAAFLAPELNGITIGVELLSGSCGSLTSLLCQNNVTNARVRFTGLAAGTEYHIRLATLSTIRYAPMLIDKNANDDITGAIDPPMGGGTFAQPLFEQTNYAASQSIGQLCGSTAYPDDDTWFHFVAGAASHTISAVQRNIHFSEPLIAGSFRIEVYDTLTTDSATLDAHVIGCGNSPVVLSGLQPGHGYWYRAYTGNSGLAQTCAFSTAVSTGNNDEATSAMSLSYGTDYGAVFNTSGATQSMPGANCVVSDFADDDIWFKFTATAAPARLVVGYHTADITLELFSGTPGNLTSIACDGNILVLPTLTVGQVYYARLYSWKNATPVDGRIGLFITPSLTANSCVDEACLGPVLLENPSIEQGANCFTSAPEVANTGGLGTPVAPGWSRMQYGSSDGHSSCADFDSNQEVPNEGLGPGISSRRLLARSGKGMAGIIVRESGTFDYHEYVQAALTEPLIPGEPYFVSFHVATLDGGIICVNGIGAALTNGPVPGDQYNILPVVPTIVSDEPICSDQWVNICGVVVPDEPLDHITIGLFYDSGEILYQGSTSTRAYYFIDDVVVARVTDPGCITGIGDVPPLDGSARSGSGDALRIYPNPAIDRVTIMNDASIIGKRGIIEVFDATGKRVQAEQVSALSALQQLDFSPDLREGLYLVVVRVDGSEARCARVILHH